MSAKGSRKGERRDVEQISVFRFNHLMLVEQATGRDQPPTDHPVTFVFLGWHQYLFQISCCNTV